MQFQDHIRRLKTSLYLDKNSPPPPRWMRMVASFYLGLLLYLAAHLMNLV